MPESIQTLTGDPGALPEVALRAGMISASNVDSCLDTRAEADTAFDLDLAWDDYWLKLALAQLICVDKDTTAPTHDSIEAGQSQECHNAALMEVLEILFDSNQRRSKSYTPLENFCKDFGYPTSFEFMQGLPELLDCMLDEWRDDDLNCVIPL